MDDLVPPEWQEAAEQVRAYLVMLRGGAPFLSPSDARRLVGWLEEGVEVEALLLALERAAQFREAQRRRGKPTRLPFTLSSASRHLGRPVSGGLPAKSKKIPPSAAAGPAAPEPAHGATAHPLAPLAAALRATASAGDPHASPLEHLAAALLALPRDTAVAPAAALVRRFLEEAWGALDPATRSAWVADALPPEEEIEDDDRAMLDAEEAARARLRAAYPFLSAATLHSLVHP